MKKQTASFKRPTLLFCSSGHDDVAVPRCRFQGDVGAICAWWSGQLRRLCRCLGYLNAGMLLAGGASSALFYSLKSTFKLFLILHVKICGD